MVRYDLWIDFNDIHRGETWTLKRFSKNPTGIQKGERLTVGDHDGLRCRADVVADRGNGIVKVRLDWSTFFETDPS